MDSWITTVVQMISVFYLVKTFVPFFIHSLPFSHILTRSFAHLIYPFSLHIFRFCIVNIATFIIFIQFANIMQIKNYRIAKNLFIYFIYFYHYYYYFGMFSVYSRSVPFGNGAANMHSLILVQCFYSM